MGKGINSPDELDPRRRGAESPLASRDVARRRRAGAGARRRRAEARRRWPAGGERMSRRHRAGCGAVRACGNAGESQHRG
jgi:hypothetical protein